MSGTRRVGWGAAPPRRRAPRRRRGARALIAAVPTAAGGGGGEWRADDASVRIDAAQGAIARASERLAAEQEPEGLDKEFLRLWVRERCDPYKDPIPDIPEETLEKFSQKYKKKLKLI